MPDDLGSQNLDMTRSHQGSRLCQSGICGARLVVTILGIVFVTSAVLKALDWHNLLLQVSLWGITTTPWLKRCLAALLLLFEGGVGFALIGRIAIRATLPVAILILSIFTGFLLWGWLYGHMQDCGCFGRFLPLSPAESVFKNFLMMGAGFLAFLSLYSRNLKPYADSTTGRTGNSITVGLRNSRRWYRRRGALLALSFIPIGTTVGFCAISIMARPGTDRVLDVSKYSFEWQGSRVDLGKGRYVVAMISDACPHCAEAMPSLKEFASQKGVPPVVCLVLGEEKSLKRFQKSHRLSFPSRLIPEIEFFDFVERSVPRFMLVSDGLVPRVWDSHLPEREDFFRELANAEKGRFRPMTVAQPVPDESQREQEGHDSRLYEKNDSVQHDGTTIDSPDAVIVFTGRTQGLLGPCRCGRKSYGGMAKRLNSIEKEREKYGARRSIVLDAGGFVSGVKQSDKERTKIYLDLLISHRFDAINLGEGDFRFGIDALTSNSQNHGPFLASALTVPDAPVLRVLRKSIDDISFLLIGLSSTPSEDRKTLIQALNDERSVCIRSDGSSSQSLPGIPGSRMEDYSSAIERLLKEERKSEDIVVVVSDLTHADNRDLMSKFGGSIGLVVGSREGKPYQVFRGVPIVRGEELGKSVTVVKMRIDKEKHKIAAIETSRIEVMTNMPDDKESARRIDRFMKENETAEEDEKAIASQVEKAN